MRFRNTLRLWIENFKNIYKILLYKLIVVVVAGALLCLLILPEIITIGQSTFWQNLSNDFGEFLFTLTPGHEGDFEIAKNALLNESLPAFGSYLLARAGEIVGVAIGCVCVILFARFAETLCYFNVGDILDDRMQTYGDMPFSSAYVKNLGRASRYALVYVPITFAFDVAILALCYLLLSVLNVFFGLFFSMLVIVSLQSLKMSLTSLWMPAMTAERKPLKEALKMNPLRYGQFWKTFSVYVVMTYLIIAINVLAVICTFASGLLVTVPASFGLLICFQYVNYYTVLGKRYFITYDSISMNVEKGDSEHFFEYVAMDEENGQKEEPVRDEIPVDGETSESQTSETHTDEQNNV